jgi:NAD(P)-dependent dehydrogenase (short-subunit alcohol dehydrogenase family)
MTDLTGKVAVIIGCSAPQGSGWAIAQRIAKAGAKVVVAARRIDNLEELANETGGIAMACDVAIEADVAAVAAAALEKYGRLDIAVNAAGYSSPSMIATAERDDFQRNLDVNFFGNVHVIRHMAKAMGSDGSIIIMSSLSEQNPMVPLVAYAASKAAVDCLVRYAAIEYGGRNIRVNSILPGPIMSEMTAEMLNLPGHLDVLKKEIPLQRVGYPEDYADAALWLCGPAFVTGIHLPVAGGMQLTRFPYPSEVPALKFIQDSADTPLAPSPGAPS